MKSYSVDLREKIVAAHLQKNISVRKVANIFSVSKSLVQKLVKQQKLEGNLQPKPRGRPQFSHLTNADIELRELVESHPDATLIELCELFADKTGNWVGRSAEVLNVKKNPIKITQNMVILGEGLKYISLIVIINSFPKIVKDILKSLPKNDYPVLNSRLFFECWLLLLLWITV